MLSIINNLLKKLLTTMLIICINLKNIIEHKLILKVIQSFQLKREYLTGNYPQF